MYAKLAHRGLPIFSCSGRVSQLGFLQNESKEFVYYRDVSVAIYLGKVISLWKDEIRCSSCLDDGNAQMISFERYGRVLGWPVIDLSVSLKLVGSGTVVIGCQKNRPFPPSFVYSIWKTRDDHMISE